MNQEGSSLVLSLHSNAYNFIHVYIFLVENIHKCSSNNINKKMASSSKQPKKDDEKKSVGGDHFRRTWDTDEFEKKAQERLQEDLDFLEGKPSFSDDPPVQREKLKARDYAVDLKSRLGKTQVITKTTPLAEQGGYYCNVCDCVVKDSINFLDHINGKKHQRNMGMSMKVERSSLDQVKARFASNKKKKEDDSKKKDYDFDSRIKELENEVCNLIPQQDTWRFFDIYIASFERYGRPTVKRRQGCYVQKKSGPKGYFPSQGIEKKAEYL